jgi:hypothetical protein
VSVAKFKPWRSYRSMTGAGPAGCSWLGIGLGDGTVPGSAKLPAPILTTGANDCAAKASVRIATLIVRSRPNPMTLAIVC